MSQKKLKDSLEDKQKFTVVVELTSGPRFRLSPVTKFLEGYRNKTKPLPDGFDLTAVTLTQNPGGTPSIQPDDIIAKARAEDLLGDLDVVPHLACKDQNADSLACSLDCYKKMSVESILALTGDKPLKAKGVFELDSLGLLDMIRRTNRQTILTSGPEQLDGAHQFYPGAAVSPFKYTEPSLMQQYYKAEKKIRSGARYFITQVGWDWRKSAELLKYMKENGLDVPVIGNVYLLSSISPAPRLMHDIKLPGCYVSDELFRKVYSESFNDHIERAAQQLAMYKSMGTAGADIGGVDDFDTLLRILERAKEIAGDWEQYKDNLSWPAPEAYYLYGPSGEKTKSTIYPKTVKQYFFNAFHRTILDKEYGGSKGFKTILKGLGIDKGEGAIYKMFNAGEKFSKYLIFDCEECGDCYLPENFGICTVGECEKHMDNAPCGDATVEGYCGNNLDHVCVGELIYKAATAEKGGIHKLRETINKSRNPALENTSSVVNYLFDRDHTMKNPAIFMGESLHASIPRTGKVMKELAKLGQDAYTKPSALLNYMKTLIESQVEDEADYIAVNVDAFGEEDPQIAVQMMTEYVKLVRKWGKAVPVCIDSSDDNVLKAGLVEWYNTEEPVKQPIINSIKIYTADEMMPLKKDYDFSFIGLLVSETPPSGPGGSHSIQELFGMASELYNKAVSRYGFKPEEIFFDSTVFPLAIDMPMEPDVPGYTYRAFETIKRIKSDPKMKKCHCSLGVSNAVRELPGRRIGVCRAYLAKAMEYGLDAAIVNVGHHYGRIEPDPGLMEMVDAFAKMDGSNERLNQSMRKMSEFCQRNRKPAK